MLSDFAKAEGPWVEALCETMADNAGLLATSQDATFQNKVHLAMQAKGFGDDEEGGGCRKRRYRSSAGGQRNCLQDNHGI